MSDNAPDNQDPAEGGQPGSDDIKDRNRRIINSLIGLGGLAGTAQWSKPIINAVSLPAHAATTFPPSGLGGGDSPLATPPPTTTKILPVD